MDETVNRSARDLKNFEFTPIGYMKEKQNGKRTTNVTGPNSDEDDNVPRRKSRRLSINDSFNSTKMFNESSQFEDTLPHVRSGKETATSDRKNLMRELKENASTSNPLKEQQEQLHKLNSENYNLRLKCNSLLKFLNNVTDEGELKKSLGLLDEVQDWKRRFDKLSEDYSNLKRDNEELVLNAKLPHTSTSANEDFKELEKRLRSLQEDSTAKQEQHQMKIDMLKSDINNLNVTIATKDDDLHEKTKKIERLTHRLQEFDNRGSESLSELEKNLDGKIDMIKKLEKELSINQNNFREKETELLKCKGSLRELERRLSQNLSIEKDSNSMKTALVEKEGQIRDLIENNEKLKSEFSQVRKKYKELTTKLDETNNLEEECNISRDELAKAKEELKKANELSRRLQNQIIETTTDNSEKISQRVKEKDLEIQNLRSQLESLKESYQLEQKNSRTDNDYEQKKLSREIALLNEEIKALQESHERELHIWKGKCDSLNRENERIINQEIGSIDAIKNNLNDKLVENEHLNRLLKQTKLEKSELSERTAQLQNSKDRYKEELKKIMSKFDNLSKEYIKLRESKDNHINDDDKYAKSQREKYNSMKQRLLDELKLLQQENLSLERKLLESKGKNLENANLQTRTSSTSQDRIDYYKLKYHTEVKQNDDLKTMNEYLNRVLRAISQHVRLDLLKIKNEVGSDIPAYFRHNTQYTQTETNNYSPMRRLNFKTVALFVQACVRMKQTAIRHRWDEQRIRYLQRKMALEDERITW